MKSVLSLEETPSSLERSFKVAAKLKHELSTDIEMKSIGMEERSSLVEDIDVTIRKVSQITDFYMRELCIKIV